MADTTRVIRPAAVLPEQAARRVLAELERQDVSRGGVWNATVGVWQRYDRPWPGAGPGAPPGTEPLPGFGPAPTIGDARLIGTIAAAYGTPTRYEITIYRATLTDHGLASGWTVEGLVDDALQYGDLTLETCPRADLVAPPAADPFRRSRH